MRHQPLSPRYYFVCVLQTVVAVSLHVAVQNVSLDSLLIMNTQRRLKITILSRREAKLEKPVPDAQITLEQTLGTKGWTDVSQILT